MSTATINDLLPIPTGTKQPHAYQVFGLEVGEQDAAKIKAAVQETVSRLKEAQESTDPKVWNKAAKLVQQAKQILADPQKKSQLDARFGIVQIGSVNTGEPSPAATSSYAGTPASSKSDPLAAVLPASDPLAAVLPSADPLAPAAPAAPVPQAPPPPPATAPTSSVAAPEPVIAAETPQKLSPVPVGLFASSDESDDGQPGQSVVVKKATKIRRRKSGAGVFVFGMFAIVMLALIGGLGFLLVKYGQVALVQSNDGLTITTNPDEEDVTINEQTPNTKPIPRRPKDNVMGNMAGDVPPPARTGVSEPVENPSTTPNDRPSRPRRPRNPRSDMDGPEMNEPEMSDPDGTGSQTADPEMTNPPPPVDVPDPDAEIMMPVTAPTTTPESEMTEEMVAAADEEIKRVGLLIRSANWKEMKPAADKLTEALLTEEQSEQADALYQLADLASFYRGGVERGVDSLTVGNDFEVTDSFRVIIVEKGDDLLVVRYNAKNRSYTFDEFPFSLAHKLATFSMDADTPTFLAAKAAYQAVAPKATDAHRSEAIEWLESIDQPIEGADPKRVAETIKLLFNSGN